MRYEAYEYLWPPRPSAKEAIPSPHLSFYERDGWIAQHKKNGTCSVIFVPPDREQIIFKNRHNEDHKRWSPNENAKRAFRSLPGNGWCVLVGELLNDKVKESTKNTTYLFDILVDNGEYLTGVSYSDRQDRLFGLFDEFEAEEYSHYVFDQTTWVAKSFVSGFDALYDELSNPDDEGLVVKDPRSVLAPCSRASSNQQWSRKCRRSTKNYPY